MEKRTTFSQNRIRSLRRLTPGRDRGTDLCYPSAAPTATRAVRRDALGQNSG